MFKDVNEPTCPICSLRSESFARNRTGDIRVRCRRCGSYILDQYFVHNHPQGAIDQWHFLAAATRQATERGTPKTIYEDNWAGLIDRHSKATEPERQSLVICYIGMMTRPGESTKLESEYDFPLFDMTKGSELIFALSQLTEQGFIEATDKGKNEVQLTLEGRIHLDEMRTSAGVIYVE